MIIKESSLTINVSDMDASISLYNSIGITLPQRWSDHYAQLRAPGLVIGLHPTSPEKLKNEFGNVAMGFTTENIEVARFHLNELSIEVNERIEEGSTFLHFKDQDVIPM